MTRLMLLAATLLSCACAAATHSTGLQSKKADGPGPALKPFGSMSELQQMAGAVIEARSLERLRQGLAETVTVSSTQAAAESITNTQHAGVDEGGIVKRHGDLLVVLRRGRLFTIGVGGTQLDSIAVADAFGPGSPNAGLDSTWYDELLIWEHTVVVIGYSYERGGSEIGLFDLFSSGDLRHRATYHLRSDDYYSRSNYASRLIGSRLVLYTTFQLPEHAEPERWLPAIRRWRAAGAAAPFDRIAPLGRVFRPVAEPGAYPAIHSMVICDLASRSFACEATVLFADPLAVYYASPTAAYAWTEVWGSDGQSILYRLPFDGAPVSAIRVRGTPPSQLALLEDQDAHLNVIVGDDDRGGDRIAVNLLRLPLDAFADGSVDAPASFYRRLAGDLGSSLHARFVGRHALAGSDHWAHASRAHRRVVVTPWRGGAVSTLALAHDVGRIEAIGEHAVAVGEDETSLHMTAIRLDADPGVAGSFVQKNGDESDDSQPCVLLPSRRRRRRHVRAAGGGLRRGVGPEREPHPVHPQPRPDVRRCRHARGVSRTGRRQRPLRGVVHRLVRQRPADLLGRPDLRADGLRNRRGPAGPRPDARGAPPRLHPAGRDRPVAPGFSRPGTTGRPSSSSSRRTSSGVR